MSSTHPISSTRTTSPHLSDSASYPMPETHSSSSSQQLDSIAPAPAPHATLDRPHFLGNGGTSYWDLENFVNGVMCKLKRYPIDFQKGRDRHCNVTPFLFNQVKIDDSKTGLNGSWISFPEHDPLIQKLHLPAKYIAISAPMPSYFFAFMRMLSQESVSLIISLTNFTEGNEIKADPYLPYTEGHSMSDAQKTYKVRCVKVHPSIDLTCGWELQQRDFELFFENQREVHNFTQLHLPFWKDFSSGNIQPLANLVKYIFHYRQENQILSPITVHCSAGIGRTGTFINCSEAYERWMLKKPVRIFDIAAQSRLQRDLLGGNKEQYEMVEKVFNYLISAQQPNSC